MKLKFIGKKQLTASVISFEFEPEQPLSWQAGQYMHYLFPHQSEDERGHERWFTNSAAPFEGKVVISTRIAADHGSSFKAALLSLKPGDQIESDGPKGSFIVEDPRRNYIWIAGGIGITPYHSILAQANHDGQKLKVDLLYANRDQDIPFKNELDQFAATNPDLKIEYITEPQRIDLALIKERIAVSDNPLVYISGPKPMVLDFQQQLIDSGFAQENIRIDGFPGYEHDQG